MIAKLAFKNFFKRFHLYFICLGIFLLSFVVAALIFIGGMQLVLSLQPNNLVDAVQNYFLTSFQIKDVFEVLNLSILERIYNDIIVIAGPSSQNVTTGLIIIVAIAVFVIYIGYKGSSALIAAMNKKKLSNKNTKKGIFSMLINLLIGAGFAALLTFLMSLWKWSGIFVLLIYLLIDAIQNIFSIHYIYFSNVKMSEMFKNKAVLKIMGLFIGSEAIFIIIAALLCLLSPIIAVIIIVPFLAYNETTVTYTVVTYFKETVKTKSK